MWWPNRQLKTHKKNLIFSSAEYACLMEIFFSSLCCNLIKRFAQVNNPINKLYNFLMLFALKWEKWVVRDIKKNLGFFFVKISSHLTWLLWDTLLVLPNITFFHIRSQSLTSNFIIIKFRRTAYWVFNGFKDFILWIWLEFFSFPVKLIKKNYCSKVSLLVCF